MDYRLATPLGLLNLGLTPDGSVIDGVALLTMGLVATCYSPFIPVGASISTSWSVVYGTSQTLWAGVTGTQWGDC